MGNYIDGAAREDFNRAKARAFVSHVLNLIKPEREKLLSLDEMRKIIPTRGESYRGIQTIDLDKIVGSEGRYQDFSKEFLPKKEHLRNRWVSIDKAHLTDVILPPIQLYEVGGVYFVRDGNHRVSVAKMQGAKMIDAEVTSLDSDIVISPEMTKSRILKEIVCYERRRFFEFTKIEEILPGFDISFTAPGRYEELLKHIYEHKYYTNLDLREEISFEEAVILWYQEVYLPIIDHVVSSNLLGYFPERTESDLYMWLVKHWHFLKEQYGQEISPAAAAADFKRKFAGGLWRKIASLFSRR
ncbi:MAG: transcriptional regulator [Spirochaetales bacterium]|nr:transcriptional regulator [Spirochaetales bacterium]